MIKIIRDENIDISNILSGRGDAGNVYEVVNEIIGQVRERGDEALFEYSAKFDKVSLESFEVSEAELDDAMKNADAELVEIMKEAAANIYEYHKNQLRKGFQIERPDGAVLGQRILPLEKVGLYIPGGTASYPSSVLMNCIPAKIAGVKEIVLVSPPTTDGKIAPNILAAAKIAGADRVFKIGGAQAVAALAYGTESIPKVDKIVGPGNRFVAEAKRQVFGKVAIDMVAGPSEILVVADADNDPAFVAADLLSQAEHDTVAAAILITTSEELAVEVSKELELQLSKLPRENIARASIDNYGAIIVCDTVERAVELANQAAPEHLELCVKNPFDYLESVVNAGSVFLGKYCPEALGDYFSGTNHTLPTNGTARFSSPLSVDDFIKKSCYTYYTKEAFEKVGKKVAAFAENEGLDAHANSAKIRYQ